MTCLPPVTLFFSLSFSQTELLPKSWSLQVLWHHSFLTCPSLCLEDWFPFSSCLPPSTLFGKLLLTLPLKGLSRLTRTRFILCHPFPYILSIVKLTTMFISPLSSPPDSKLSACESVFVFSHILLFVTPSTCSPPGSSTHGIFPGKNTGVACHFPLQGIFPTKGLNPHLLSLLHWQTDSSPLSHLGSPKLCENGDHFSNNITDHDTCSVSSCWNQLNFENYI